MMRSAMAFLPDSMITFMNLDRSTEPNFGSGRMSRLGTSRRRGISLFLLLQLARTFSWCAPRTTRYRAIHLLGKPDGPPYVWPSGLLRTLRAVLRTRLLAVFHALQVERTAHDVITHTRQILDT